MLRLFLIRTYILSRVVQQNTTDGVSVEYYAVQGFPFSLLQQMCCTGLKERTVDIIKQCLEVSEI